MGLKRYQAKRDFARTREPRGASTGAKAKGEREGEGGGRRFLFIVQKHAARRLHYDFRLELEGVLKSWALPKGAPTALGEKRLAVQVEDHPVEYAHFEGTIPEGNYGAGTVMLWDAGICESMEAHPVAALRRGKLAFQLDGKKLKGHWSLIRMSAKAGQKDNDNAWLLIKTQEEARPVSARADDRSVASGRTMKQISKGGGPTWESNHPKSKPRAGLPGRARPRARAVCPRPSVAHRPTRARRTAEAS
jgi:bifunctional non-homologous end joining protein LigD